MEGGDMVRQLKVCVPTYYIFLRKPSAFKQQTLGWRALCVWLVLFMKTCFGYNGVHSSVWAEGGWFLEFFINLILQKPSLRLRLCGNVVVPGDTFVSTDWLDWLTGWEHNLTYSNDCSDCRVLAFSPAVVVLVDAAGNLLCSMAALQVSQGSAAAFQRLWWWLLYPL